MNANVKGFSQKNGSIHTLSSQVKHQKQQTTPKKTYVNKNFSLNPQGETQSAIMKSNAQTQQRQNNYNSTQNNQEDKILNMNFSPSNNKSMNLNSSKLLNQQSPQNDFINEKSNFNNSQIFSPSNKHISNRISPERIVSKNSLTNIPLQRSQSPSKQSVINNQRQKEIQEVLEKQRQIQKQRQRTMADPEKLNEEKKLLKQMILELEEKKIKKQNEIQNIKSKCIIEEKDIKHLRENYIGEKEKFKSIVDTIAKENKILEEQLKRTRNAHEFAMKERNESYRLEETFKMEIVQLKENIKLLEGLNEKEILLFQQKIKQEEEKNEKLLKNLEEANFNLDVEEKLRNSHKQKRSKIEQNQESIQLLNHKKEELVKNLSQINEEYDKLQKQVNIEIQNQEKEYEQFGNVIKEEQRSQEINILDLEAEIEILIKQSKEEEQIIFKDNQEAEEQLNLVIQQQKKVSQQYLEYENYEKNLQKEFENLKSRQMSEVQIKKELEEEQRILIRQEIEIQSRREMEINKLNQENLEIQIEIKQIQDQIKKIQEKTDETQIEIEQRKSQMREDLELKNKQIQDYENLINKLNIAKREQQKEISHLQSELQQQKKILEQIKEVDNLRNELIQQEQILQKNIQLKDNIELELDVIDKKIKSNNEDIQNIKEQIGNYNQRSAANKIQNDKIQQEINQLQIELGKQKKKKK